MTLDQIETTRNRAGYIVLNPTYSTLYKRTQYNTPLDYIQNTIYEYDIRAANLTMLTQQKASDRKTLAMLGELSRDAREIAVGKMIQKNPEIYKIISKGILRARRDLFRVNGIQDYEIVSIRNDAVFIAGRRLKTTVFGEVEFRMKNRYAMFHRIEGIEFLYDKRHSRTDVKGVDDRVVTHPDHQAGMMQFFNTVFQFLCYERRADLSRYLIQFAHDYKAMNLPVAYYRELNSENVYRTKMELAEFSYNMSTAGEGDKDIINPVYNYKRFILPLIQQYI